MPSTFVRLLAVPGSVVICRNAMLTLIPDWPIHLPNIFVMKLRTPTTRLAIFLPPVLDPDILLLYAFLYHWECSLLLNITTTIIIIIIIIVVITGHHHY